MFVATVPGLEARRFTTLAEANEFYQTLPPDQRRGFTLVTEAEPGKISDREARVKSLRETYQLTRGTALRLLRYEAETGETVEHRLARVAERHRRGEIVRRIMREKGCTYAWAYHLAAAQEKGPSEPPGAAENPGTGPNPTPRSAGSIALSELTDGKVSVGVNPELTEAQARDLIAFVAGLK